MVAEVMIHCGLEGDLTVSVSVPKGCPYELEHTLLKDATEQIKEGWDNERTEQ